MARPMMASMDSIDVSRRQDGVALRRQLQMVFLQKYLMPQSIFHLLLLQCCALLQLELRFLVRVAKVKHAEHLNQCFLTILQLLMPSLAHAQIISNPVVAHKEFCQGYGLRRV